MLELTPIAARLQLGTWDTRMWRCVTEYSGHYNQHTKAEVYVDSTEGLLFAGT